MSTSRRAGRVQVVFGHPLQPDAVDLAGRVERHLFIQRSEERVWVTPLAGPVLPEVKKIATGASGSGCGGSGSLPHGAQASILSLSQNHHYVYSKPWHVRLARTLSG